MIVVEGLEFANVDAVLGVDLSLTAPGLARILEPWGGSVPHATATTLSGMPNAKRRKATELDLFAERIVRGAESMLARSPHSIAVIEAVLVQSGTGKATERAALWWMVAAGLEKLGCAIVTVHPSTRKSLALDDQGRGELRSMTAAQRKNAGKRIGLQSMRRRWPSVVLPDDNAADALVCAELGARALGWAGLPENTNPNLPKAIGALGIEERNTQ